MQAAGLEPHLLVPALGALTSGRAQGGALLGFLEVRPGGHFMGGGHQSLETPQGEALGPSVQCHVILKWRAGSFASCPLLRIERREQRCPWGGRLAWSLV